MNYVVPNKYRLVRRSRCEQIVVSFPVLVVVSPSLICLYGVQFYCMPSKTAQLHFCLLKIVCHMYGLSPDTLSSTDQKMKLGSSARLTIKQHTVPYFPCFRLVEIIKMKKLKCKYQRQKGCLTGCREWLMKKISRVFQFCFQLVEYFPIARFSLFQLPLIPFRQAPLIPH